MSPTFTSRIRCSFASVFLFFAALAVAAEPPKAPHLHPPKPPIPGHLPTTAEMTRGMEKETGFLTLYIDVKKTGAIYLHIPPPGDDGKALEWLWSEGLRTGLGSNPVGLDRGQLGDARVVEVRRLGRKVLFQQPNLRFRATADSALERRAARESFSGAVIWATEIVALDADGASLIDLTDFLLHDAHDVRETLRDTGQGDFELRRDRSAVDLGATLVFPDNVELESILTWTTEDEPGDHVRGTSPIADALSLVQHHSFIRLPDDGYQMRRADPRVGVFGIEYQDYSAPLDGALSRRFISRHRLEKIDPTAERSRVVEPIVYYVDPGAPEPIRSALIDGAEWWAEAFEAAGFIDAYRVELLPDDAHPLDVRYNVIQWVHRSTRGWSYGGGIFDPRTGEILKGHVSLGSLRVRQDRLIFEGLAGTSKTGSGAADDPVELALARIRQLSAHEVGHTLGLAHNFIASAYDDRASVMDYPAPLVDVRADDTLDFSRAYGVGIGSWDKHSVRYAYAQFAPGADEDAELRKIVLEGLAAGMHYVADKDSRPAYASDPRSNLWDNGSDAIDELEKLLRIRRIALENFGEENILPGRPLAELEEVLVPLYFYHRYQLDAAVKTIGGMEMHYAVRGDDMPSWRGIPADRQRRALESILGILDPEALSIPDDVLEILAPRPDDWPRHRELFASSTGPAFDALGAAATAADDVARVLTQPERLARLREFHRRDENLPSVSQVLDALIEQIFQSESGEPRRSAAIRESARRAVVDRLIARAASPETPAEIRAEIDQALREASRRAGEGSGAHFAGLAGAIELHLDREALTLIPSTPSAADKPPGSPIGGR